jgi:dipeptidyl aminopeptidase/acylaminoacyl peptidase
LNRIVVVLSVLLVSKAALSGSTIERYGVLPKIQQMSVSPDGEKVAFRMVTLEQDIVSVVTVNPAKKLAAIDVSSVKSGGVSFISNNNLLLNLSAEISVPGFRGEFEVSTAVTYDIKENKYNQLLVPGKYDIYAGQSELDHIVGISPDGEWVYMPAYSGNPTFALGRQLNPPNSLFKVKIDGTGRPLIHKSGKGHARDYFVANDGTVLAREAFDESQNKHSVSAYHGKKPVEIFTQETPYLTKDFIGVSLDEKRMMMVANNSKTNREAIYTVSMQDGKIEGPLYQREDADIVRQFTDWQRKVLGIQYSGFYPSYTFFDADLDSRVQGILTAFPKHSVWITDISPDRQHVLVQVEGSQSAGDYFLFSKDKEPAFISSLRPNIPADEIHPIGSLTFKARDGLKIPTVITIPRTKLDSIKNLPAVVLPHGGPASFDSIGFDYQAQALAEQGYLVLQPNFRGSKGFGEEHEVAGYGEWGRKSLDDLTDAVDYFSKNGMIDRERVCIVGSSYGGYAALAGGAFMPDVYKCVVSINGLGNLDDMLERTKHERGENSSALAFWEAQILGFGETDENIAKQRSPELSASKFKAPVLLIHSEKDNVVHPRQSITMYRALKKADKQVDKIELEGEDHNLSHGPTRLKALKAMVEFVNKHI